MIVRVPGVTDPGSVCQRPVFSTDFFPTMLELASLPPVPHLHADGESLVPLFGAPSQANRERSIGTIRITTARAGRPARRFDTAIGS